MSDTKPKQKYKKLFKSESPNYSKTDLLLPNDFKPSIAERDAWVKHSKYLNDFIKNDTDPRDWTENDIVDFVTSLPTCKDHGALFGQQNFDGESFLMLSQQDLVDILKIKVGPAIKVYNSIVLLRQNVHRYFT